MDVRLKTGSYWYPIGSETFFRSFFSTIAYHLEDNHWGSKYPYIMENLYYGQLQHIDYALNELDDIKLKMEIYTRDQIIWDIHDITKRPPWEDKIAENQKTLSDSFITMNGENLFDVFRTSFNKAKEIGTYIQVVIY